jgi:CRP-like cAMP-binding protein
MASIMRIDADRLSRFETFSQVTRTKLDRLAAAATVWRFQRRFRIFTGKESATYLYILLGGVAKLSALNNQRQPVLVNLLGPGDMFGISALFPGAAHRFRCDAFTDCVVARVDPEKFVDIMLGVSLTDLRNVLDITVRETVDLLALQSMMLRLPVLDRIVAALAALSFKFGAPDDRGTLLNIPLTHEDLADLVGASRQVVSSHLSELERNGAIIRKRRRLILVPTKLSNEGAVDPPQEMFLPGALLAKKERVLRRRSLEFAR